VLVHKGQNSVGRRKGSLQKANGRESFPIAVDNKPEEWEKKGREENGDTLHEPGGGAFWEKILITRRDETSIRIRKNFSIAR